MNQHGEEAYIGFATFNRQSAPAELVLSDQYYGLYFPWGAKVYHITENIQYYAKEPNCEYKWISSSSGQNVHKAIKNSSPDGYTFYIGRTAAHNTWHVGKVTLEHKVLYYGHNMLTQKTAHYEVLICNKITPTTSTTTTTQRTTTDNSNESSKDLFCNLQISELSNRLMAKVHENARLQEQLHKCETRDFV